MKIEGIKTEKVLIEITENERKQLVKDFLYERFKLESTHYDGWVFIDGIYLIEKWENSGGSHTSWSQKKLRKATKQDKMVLKILEEI